MPSALLPYVDGNEGGPENGMMPNYAIEEPLGHKLQLHGSEEIVNYPKDIDNVCPHDYRIDASHPPRCRLAV